MGKPDFKAFKQVFDAIDTDKSGKIDVKELAVALKKIELDMDQDTIKTMIELMDQDIDGKLNFKEFCVFINVCENADPETPASVLFYAADQDYSGSIDKSELNGIFKKLGIKASKDQIDSVMKEVADNKDSTISYEMFIQLIDALSQ
ncbi:EF_hand domain-containing protein [Hexamita inflata]|uniref:EF hand domain-containing protein n=1 Tax=Hexamita inflata TaxID=28002 RepID=A0AA86R5I9_9EUKA|nr:EF hand domain-containing protein [Hexamita inflata]CAI9949976.1 EF hand domain-containing protein [Hexamita inflata]CAI9956721.1 EF hand domain-containing protein [Hexamita inflata]CAI9970965.1 EF hand domain-containing protein [Hexamita inflata]